MVQKDAKKETTVSKKGCRKIKLEGRNEEIKVAMKAEQIKRWS